MQGPCTARHGKRNAAMCRVGDRLLQYALHACRSDPPLLCNDVRGVVPVVNHEQILRRSANDVTDIFVVGGGWV
jgi:hypothetical protein